MCRKPHVSASCGRGLRVPSQTIITDPKSQLKRQNDKVRKQHVFPPTEELPHLPLKRLDASAAAQRCSTLASHAARCSRPPCETTTRHSQAIQHIRIVPFLQKPPASHTQKSAEPPHKPDSYLQYFTELYSSSAYYVTVTTDLCRLTIISVTS